jgi:hypothetical protein
MEKRLFLNLFLSHVSFLILFLLMTACQKSWQPAEGPLLTKWATEISPDNVLAEYPRPQFVRENWKNLNGLWNFAIRTKDEAKPQHFEGQLLVPFPVESALSGVAKAVGETNRLWYQRIFSVPEDWRNKQIKLNFGAVDWETKVWVNGKEIGVHQGGYDSFSFDITGALNETEAQEIVISVWDPVDSGTQPRGKQVKQPRGIWYTSVTGIWQTVWIEPVNKTNIKSIKIVPDIDAEIVNITTTTSNLSAELNIIIQVKADGKTIKEIKTQAGKTADIPIKNPKLWSPDNPFLYDLIVILKGEGGNKLDEINSYFGMRKIALGKDDNGYTRLMLNNEFVFQFGPLDQGWWPDGLYTAPSDEALRYDIEVTKKLGFNMARKHVKIEPDRWYYWCDKIGLLVWQDMPSGDKYIRPDQPDFQRSIESANQFEFELKQLIDNFGNHPSIVMWIPFNEGWGQYDTPRIVDYVKTLDPSRLVINTSGWADRGVGDVFDIHSYPGPAMPTPEENRAIVLGEFGGLGLPITGYTWQDENNWGYRSYQNADELTTAYRDLIKKLYPFVIDGLSAAVYTQTTDVEIEVNGLMTYDRAIIKMNPDEVQKINSGYLPPVIMSENDIFLENAEVVIKNIVQPGKIYFTLDGSQPDQNSQLYDRPIVTNKTSTIKAITLWGEKEKSSVSEQIYKRVTLRESQKTSVVKSGIVFDYFENDSARWNKLPDFSQLTLKANDVAYKMDLAQRDREENFGVVYRGFFKAQKDGIYTFYTNSDDGSQLFMSGELIVDNDGVHGMVEKSGQIALQTGLHAIRVIFFQGRGGKGLNVSYQGPGMKKQEMLSNVLFHE